MWALAPLATAETYREYVTRSNPAHGSTWAAASNPRTQANSRLVNPPRTSKPWVSRNNMVGKNGGRDFDNWIRGHIDSKVTWM